MENNQAFTYTYSAAQQEEIKNIRKKYVEPEEDKMEQLRRFKGRFACFNSVDLASDDERAELIVWIEQLLDIRFQK